MRRPLWGRAAIELADIRAGRVELLDAAISTIDHIHIARHFVDRDRARPQKLTVTRARAPKGRTEGMLALRKCRSATDKQQPPGNNPQRNKDSQRQPASNHQTISSSREPARRRPAHGQHRAAVGTWPSAAEEREAPDARTAHVCFFRHPP